MSAAGARYRIGVDVGGTFTDCVLLRPDGSILLEKTPTTPEDQSDGVLAGIARLAEAERLTDVTALLRDTASIVHGTTAADNTMIQMTGAPTGLLVTEGFRDEIEMRRCFKEDIWDPAYPAPEPIARRRVRLEIAERLTSEGTVDVELDEPGVRGHGAAAGLRRDIDRGVLPAQLPQPDPRAAGPGAHPGGVSRRRARVALARGVAQAARVRADLHDGRQCFRGAPIVRYLGRLEARLAEAGFAEELLLATSSGGVATPGGTKGGRWPPSAPGPPVVSWRRRARRARQGSATS